MRRATLLLLLGAALGSAFRPAAVLRRSPSVRLMADDEDDNAFAAFAKAVKQQNARPGEGAPTKDRELPIRLGGAKRDGSLGDLRAAFNTIKTLQDPRLWQAEEYGFVAVLLTFVAGTAFFYFTYVQPPAAKEKPVGPAQQQLTRALAQCENQECLDRVMREKEPDVVLERQLDDCLDKAFSGTERNMCKSKFGGALTPFGF